MYWKRLFATLLAGSMLAVAGLAVQAQDTKDEKKEEKKEEKKVEEIKPPKGVETGPTHHVVPYAPDSGCGCGYTTVWVTECVPETYTATRTVMKPVTTVEKYTAYRTECVPEKYTAYRTECVAEQQARQVTVNRMVCEQRTEMRTVWTCVPTVEQRTICKPICVTKQVTTFECVRKDHGHYECVEEEVCPGWMAKMRHKMRGECGEPCPEHRTKKVWCPNIVTEQVPVTKCVKTTEYVHEVVNVTVMKKVASQQPHTFTVNRCVPETHTQMVTVMVPHTVAYEATRMVPHTIPYEATRNVTRCVPVQETYTATRMVSRQVARQVPVAPANECCESGHGRRSWFAGFGKHRGGCGCD